MWIGALCAVISPVLVCAVDMMSEAGGMVVNFQAL